MASWQLEILDCVARLTLCRPPVNSLDAEALGELEKILTTVSDGRGLRALVITGGPGAVFCSGGDLKYWRRIRDGRHVSESGRCVFDHLERMEIPTVAALNGGVIGDGLSLALACDLRIASTRASIRLPELSLGFIPGWLPIHHLVSAVGRSEATKMLLTGAPCDAAEARRVGLVHDVVPPERLEEAAIECAGRLAAASSHAVRAAKSVLRGGDERVWFQEVWGSTDWEEGIAALLAKRAPNFTGGVVS
jgi:enoyl-CoA hydratase